MKKRNAGILVGLIIVLAVALAYLSAAYPTTIYQDDINLTLGYTEQDIPFSANWPKSQVQVTLNIHQSFALWNVTIHDAQNHVIWTHTGGTTGQIIISSDWQPMSGSGKVRVRTLGNFNATVTVETKGQPW